MVSYIQHMLRQTRNRTSGGPPIRSAGITWDRNVRMTTLQRIHANATLDRAANQWNQWAQDQHAQRAVAIADSTSIPLDVAKIVNDQAGAPEVPFPEQSYPAFQDQQAAQRQQNAQKNQARLEQLNMDRVLALLDS